MKTTTTLAILSMIVFACHRRTVASDEIILSNKTEVTNTKTTPTGEAMSAGQTIYGNRCGRCHYIKTVQDYTVQQWDNILKSMIPKARLNKDEAAQLTSYITEHAKK